MSERVFSREFILNSYIDDVCLDILIYLGLANIISSTSSSYMSYIINIRTEVLQNESIKLVLFKYDKSLSYEFLPKIDYDLGIA